MSIGQAQCGITNLLVHRDCRERVRGIVQFIAENNAIKAVASSIVDEYLPEWYFDHSLIVVSHTHNMWERSRKTKRKFGDLRRSEHTDLHEVIRNAMPHVKDYVETALDEQSR